MKALTTEQEEALHELYYDRKFVMGRDRIWHLLNSEGTKISKEQVMSWLRRQESHQMFLRPKRVSVVRSTIIRAPGRQMGVDLIDMQKLAWEDYRYIITGVDLHSKKGWARALKNKTKETVGRAMNSILQDTGGMKSVRSDRGAEFVNPVFRAVLEKNHSKQVLSLAGKPQSNGAIERWNQTLKTMIKRAMRITDSRDWPEFLQQIVDNYNASRHRIILETPNDAHKGEAPDVIVKRLMKSATAKSKPPAFKVGDEVRIRKKRVTNDGELWSKKVYKIAKVLRPRTPFGVPIYRVDPEGEPRTSGSRGHVRDWVGNLYEEELQRITGVDEERAFHEKWSITRLVRKATRGGVPGFIVKWKTGEETFEPTSLLNLDVPHLVRRFRA